MCVYMGVCAKMKISNVMEDYSISQLCFHLCTVEWVNKDPSDLEVLRCQDTEVNVCACKNSLIIIIKYFVHNFHKNSINLHQFLLYNIIIILQYV